MTLKCNIIPWKFMDVSSMDIHDIKMQYHPLATHSQLRPWSWSNLGKKWSFDGVLCGDIMTIVLVKRPKFAKKGIYTTCWSNLGRLKFDHDENSWLSCKLVLDCECMAWKTYTLRKNSSPGDSTLTVQWTYVASGQLDASITCIKAVCFWREELCPW